MTNNSIDRGSPCLILFHIHLLKNKTWKLQTHVMKCKNKSNSKLHDCRLPTRITRAKLIYLIYLNEKGTKSNKKAKEVSHNNLTSNKRVIKTRHLEK